MTRLEMKFTRMLADLLLVLALAACGNQTLDGEYKNQGNGIYSAVEFKGKSTAVVKGMGMTFPTSYERDGQLIRLKTDKSDLLFTDNAYMAKQLGEAQYGVGNVLNYTEVWG